MMRLGYSDKRAARTRIAAPAGGARLRGRGCILILTLYANPLVAEVPLSTPSGQDVTLSEVLLDENPGDLWVRFRFVAPEIARDTGRIDVATAAEDMQVLCDDIAISYLSTHDLKPERIVISLSDRVVPFGQSDADATQFFELYSLKDGACMWEEF